MALSDHSFPCACLQQISSSPYPSLSHTLSHRSFIDSLLYDLLTCILCKQHPRTLSPSPSPLTSLSTAPHLTRLTRLNPTHRASFVGSDPRVGTVGFSSYLIYCHVFIIIRFIAKLKICWRGRSLCLIKVASGQMWVETK